MDIYTAMSAIVAIQEDIAITVPRRFKVGKVYEYPPAQNEVLTSNIVFINSWTLDDEERQPSNGRRQDYRVHMQLFVYNANRNTAARIATAFMPAVMAAFEANTDALLLAGAVSKQKLIGRDPTLVRMDYGAKTYIGLDLDLELLMQDTRATV